MTRKDVNIPLNSPGGVTSYERSVAKTFVFGILYGKSIQSIARDYFHGDIDFADKLYNDFLNGMPNIKEWINKRHEEVRDTGKTTIPFFDHKLNIGYPANEYSSEYRQSVNYPIQSGSSSFCAYQMYMVYNECKSRGIEIYPYAFIHDSIIAEVPVSKIFEYLEIVKYYYITYPYNKLGIPDGTDFEIGIGNFKKLEIKYDIVDGKARFELGIKDIYNEMSLLDKMKRYLRDIEITNDTIKRKVLIKTLDSFNSKCSYNFIMNKEIDIHNIKGTCSIDSNDNYLYKY